MKTLKYLLVASVLGLSVGSVGCGGENAPQGSISPKTIKASQLVFGNSGSGSAMKSVTSGGCLDTETKFLAENVTLNNGGLGIGSSNVQDAFGEVAPDVKTVAVNSWKVIDLKEDADKNFPADGGTLTLNSDDSFVVNARYDESYASILGSFQESVTRAGGGWNLNDFKNFSWKYYIIEDSILSLSMSYDRVNLQCKQKASNPNDPTSYPDCAFEKIIERNSWPIVKITPTKIVTTQFILTH